MEWNAILGRTMNWVEHLQRSSYRKESQSWVSGNQLIQAPCSKPTAVELSANTVRQRVLTTATGEVAVPFVTSQGAHWTVRHAKEILALTFVTSWMSTSATNGSWHSHEVLSQAYLYTYRKSVMKCRFWICVPPVRGPGTQFTDHWKWHIVIGWRRRHNVFTSNQREKCNNHSGQRTNWFKMVQWEHTQIRNVVEIFEISLLCCE